jgi:hypothetical protein
VWVAGFCRLCRDRNHRAASTCQDGIARDAVTSPPHGYNFIPRQFIGSILQQTRAPKYRRLPSACQRNRCTPGGANARTTWSTRRRVLETLGRENSANASAVLSEILAYAECHHAYPTINPAIEKSCFAQRWRSVLRAHLSMKLACISEPSRCT